jgi:hypothetical protein
MRGPRFFLTAVGNVVQALLFVEPLKEYGPMNISSFVAAVALVAAPLSAQQPRADSPPHPMMMDESMMEQMGPGMMKVMLYTPQHLLARKDALALTADQVTRLTALRDGSKGARDAASAEAQAHIKELEAAADAPKPDTAALKVHFQAAHNAMGKAHWAVLVSSVQARTVLTDPQRAKVRAWADSLHAWMRQHREMMQPGRAH